MSNNDEIRVPGLIPIPGTLALYIPDVQRVKRLRERTAARDDAQVFGFALAVYEKLLAAADAGEVPAVVTETRAADGAVNGMVEYAPIRLYPGHEPDKKPKPKV